MTRDEILALTKRGLAAWNAHDAAALGALYAPDARVQDSGTPAVIGRDAAVSRAQTFMSAFPDIAVELIRVCIEDNTVTQEWRVTGTHQGDLMGIAPTGRRSETLGCTVAEFADDGLIERETVYWDSAKLLRDLGVMPEIAAAQAV